MSITEEIANRSNNQCELCGNKESLKVYEVLPNASNSIEKNIFTCNVCLDQIENNTDTNPNHWRCLTESMWSEFPAVKLVAWRMLQRLKDESWAHDLLDTFYLDDVPKDWIKDSKEDSIIHKDSNGVTLLAGDTVIITKDLNVKGSSLTAKRGTSVRNISLVYDNAAQIEGKVEGQQIVILTEFVKKS